MMEVFANKVRNGGGVCFDPLLKERGGQIVGEAPQHDMEMLDVVISVMVDASQGALKDYLNPF